MSKMIKRKAVIIGNSGGYRNLKLLEGVIIDVENYKTFLLSQAGGEWHPNEVVTLIDKEAKDVIDELNKDNVEYSFTVFTGHGFINTYTSSDSICLKDTDISIGKLVTSSKKQTIILDACRQYEFVNLKSIILEKAEYTLNEKKNNSRLIFDNALAETPEGIILIFSSKAGQSSGDNSLLGGYFSYSFLEAGKLWRKKSTGILRIDKAVQHAEIIMKNTFSTLQTPQMSGQIRRLTFPPFAIS